MEYVWLALGLLILIVLIRKPFMEGVIGALDRRSARIAQEIEDARRLHEEAKALLEKYERHLREGEELAAGIRERALAEQQRLEARLKAEFEALTGRRTQQALDRIAQEEARTVADLRTRAASLAVRATRTLLEEKLDQQETQRVMARAVGEVTRKLA